MNKKRIFILAAIVIVAIVAAFFAGRGGFKSGEEKLTETLVPKIEGIGAVPKVNVKVMPTEATDKLQIVPQVKKDHWERLGQLSIELQVKNLTTDQTLVSGTITKTLYDKSNQVIGYPNSVVRPMSRLGPGESVTLNLDMLATADKVGKAEISLKDIVFTGGTTSQAPPTQEKPKEEPVGGSIYTISNYPKNPKTPGEVVAAYIFFIYEKNYSKAIELTSRDDLEIRKMTNELLNAAHRQFFRGRELREIRIRGVEIKGEKADIAEVMLYYTDGSQEDSGEIWHLKMEDGKWRLRE